MPGVANFLAVADGSPTSPDGVRNDLDYRPPEGFVLAVSPFNYASMNHLALGPALLGNVVVWKPAEATALVSHLMLSLLRAAGLPDGVINLVHGDAPRSGTPPSPTVTSPRDSTGSTTRSATVACGGRNVDRYRKYPRVVGETGGRDLCTAVSVSACVGTRRQEIGTVWSSIPFPQLGFGSNRREG